MPRYRHALPQLSDRIFLSDGGLETTLIFHDGIDLPHFASFDLLKSEEGRQILRGYYDHYAGMARDAGLGFILESPTWRSNPDWGRKIGYTDAELDRANADAITLMSEVRDAFDTGATPLVISGCIGPRGDGYVAGKMMSVAEAEAYHGRQVGVFADSEADMTSAFTMTYPEEAIGVARAAKAAGIPSVISFTVETDGRLPSGHTVKEAIVAVEEATDEAPAYYMLNCAHPTHFADALEKGEAWLGRVRGLRANASKRSHAELDNAPDLDDGNPVELGGQYRDLRTAMPQLTVLGGCCGTDHRHVHEIRRACAPEKAVA